MSEKLYENLSSIANIINKEVESHILVCRASVYTSMSPEVWPSLYESIQ